MELSKKDMKTTDNLPDHDVLAADIIQNMEAGLESFREIMIKLNSKSQV